MLTKSPLFYYNIIRKKYKNSYLAEDDNQIIIGIDCDYIDAYQYSYSSLENYYQQQVSIAPFAGLFGVFAYETIHFFEKIEHKSNSQYEFPAFVFANAKAYLHYSKINKVFSSYGDEDKYFHFLEQANISSDDKKENTTPYYKTLTNVEQEKKHFLEIIEKAKEYIKSGDVFQVVLSEQLCLESDMDSLDFYQKLSLANPSPYMFHFPTKYGDVVGSSPEILVEMTGSHIHIAPIAGSRPRGKDANEDEYLAKELLSDPKECAEHRMLVDLARNDIGKFAEKGSVVVKNMMHILRYEHIMHIESDVFRIKLPDVSLFDVISIVFPAGTLSGAPKIRAMEIINELEIYKRNIYGGGIGFLHFNGNIQLAILIRSAFFKNRNFENQKAKEIFVQAGAGIVYDSSPEKEYEEICHKRASVINVFTKNCNKQ